MDLELVLGCCQGGFCEVLFLLFLEEGFFVFLL